MYNVWVKQILCGYDTRSYRFIYYLYKSIHSFSFVFNYMLIKEATIGIRKVHDMTNRATMENHVPTYSYFTQAHTHKHNIYNIIMN